MSADKPPGAQAAQAAGMPGTVRQPDRQPEAARHRAHAAGMIAVFMGDQHCGDVGGRTPDERQAFLQLRNAQPTVEQNARITEFD